jgi:hypothetical protein
MPHVSEIERLLSKEKERQKEAASRCLAKDAAKVDGVIPA